MLRTLATLCAAVTATVCPAPVAWGQDLRADPTLVPESPVARPGQTLWIAIDFGLDDGWHTYWPGINDTGMALGVDIDHPPQAEPGDLLWPAPHRYSPAEGILDHIYEERMTVLLPVKIAPDAEPGEKIRLDLDMRWLVCEAACILESARRSIEIPVSDALAKPSRETAELFEATRARLPRPVTDADPVRWSFSGDSLSIQSNGATALAFYPAEDCRTPRDLLAQGEAEGDTLVLDFRDGDEAIKGVLEVWSSPRESKVFTIQWPPPQEDDQAPAVTDRRADQ